MGNKVECKSLAAIKLLFLHKGSSLPRPKFVLFYKTSTNCFPLIPSVSSPSGFALAKRATVQWFTRCTPWDECRVLLSDHIPVTGDHECLGLIHDFSTGRAKCGSIPPVKSSMGGQGSSTPPRPPSISQRGVLTPVRCKI